MCPSAYRLKSFNYRYHNLHVKYYQYTQRHLLCVSIYTLRAGVRSPELFTLSMANKGIV